MKTILTTLIAVAITSVALAQNTDKVLARVRYSFIHIQDTTQKDKPYTENMLLAIGKNASVYTSYDKVNQTLDRAKQIQEQMKNQAGSGTMSIKIDGTTTKPVSQLDYYYFAQEGKFFTKERVFNNYLMEEPAPKISWKISKDTASFSGVHCQKATTYFKGRNWVAWFAPDMPFQSGPWKLNGLPGLIITAYDEKKEVQFQFNGIENVNAAELAKQPEPSQPKLLTPNGSLAAVNILGMDAGNSYLGPEIKLPEDAIKTTRKELDKLKEARDKDPQGFINAQLAASGINAGVSRNVRMAPASGGTTVNKIVINNPIELPEKK